MLRTTAESWRRDLFPNAGRVESMKSFSDDLRRERERQGVSLETISQITKVFYRHLQELEAGDFGSLPGGVFRKGILRGYLSALHLEPASWIARFELCLADLDRPAETPETVARFAENISRNRPETPLPDPNRWPGVVAMLLVLLVFGWCVWRFALRGHVVLTRLPATLPAHAALLLPVAPGSRSA